MDYGIGSSVQALKLIHCFINSDNSTEPVFSLHIKQQGYKLSMSFLLDKFVTLIHVSRGYNILCVFPSNFMLHLRNQLNGLSIRLFSDINYLTSVFKSSLPQISVIEVKLRQIAVVKGLQPDLQGAAVVMAIPSESSFFFS